MFIIFKVKSILQPDPHPNAVHQNGQKYKNVNAMPKIGLYK